MRLVVSLVAVSLVGCVAQDDVSSTSQDEVVYNRLASNRLASNRLASNRLASNRLTSGPHIGGGLSLNAVAQDLVDAGAQDVLSYMVSCALPSGVTVYDSNDQPYLGEIGVAPDWVNRPLDDRDQRWLSACLFARTNDLDVAVPISMRGPNNALTPDAGEIAAWTLQQGAFYGNYFTPLSEPILWAACSGSDDTTSEQRICAEPDPSNPGYTKCGFIYTGDCQPSQGHHRGWWGGWHGYGNTGACDFFDSQGTFFDDCHLDVERDFHLYHHDWHWQWHEDFSEVITVYVQP
ncbi:MAG TPA: hypothetical protein VMJ10_22220 [Kofleriaceae bacterium]|nr:hypothetical protein [Kofleriaceae bacterium]